jgi:hypothetical protein
MGLECQPPQLFQGQVLSHHLHRELQQATLSDILHASLRVHLQDLAKKLEFRRALVVLVVLFDQVAEVGLQLQLSSPEEPGGRGLDEIGDGPLVVHVDGEQF